jgi:ribokinase
MDAAFVDTCEAQIARSDIVVSGLEMPAEAAVRTMQLGKQHGIRTLLNPAPAVPLPDDVFPLIDYMTPNETELRILMGLAPDDSTPTLELAKRLQARGTKHLIVTMGENGAMILSGDQVTEVAGLKVDVVDTTGAGDAFSAGLAVALVEGRPLLEAVRFANCCGALACTKLGVIPALAQRSAVDQLYAQYYG